jgi:hypothetical protein
MSTMSRDICLRCRETQQFIVGQDSNQRPSGFMWPEASTRRKSRVVLAIRIARVAQSETYRPQSPPIRCTMGRRERQQKARDSLQIRRFGAIAQLAERLDRTQEVGGSNPPSSTLEAPAHGGLPLFAQAIHGLDISGTRALECLKRWGVSRISADVARFRIGKDRSLLLPHRRSRASAAADGPSR